MNKTFERKSNTKNHRELSKLENEHQTPTTGIPSTAGSFTKTAGDDISAQSYLPVVPTIDIFDQHVQRFVVSLLRQLQQLVKLLNKTAESQE